MCVSTFSFHLNLPGVFCFGVFLQIWVGSPEGGEVLVLLCSSVSWLWPRWTVVLLWRRLMSGFAALQWPFPLCWCEAADHHIGPILPHSYKSPTVRLGPNGTATAGDGQACQQGGRGENEGKKQRKGGGMKVWAQYCVFASTYDYIRSPTVFP